MDRGGHRPTPHERQFQLHCAISYVDNLPVIAIRFALYADLMVLTGVTAFSLYALTREERSSGTLAVTKPAAALSLIGFLLSGLGMLALVASMTGSGLWAVDGGVLREIIGESAIGTAWIVRMAAMAAAVFPLSAFPEIQRRPAWVCWDRPHSQSQH